MFTFGSWNCRTGVSTSFFGGDFCCSVVVFIDLGTPRGQKLVRDGLNDMIFMPCLLANLRILLSNSVTPFQ